MAVALAAELFVGNRRDFDVEVDAVEERPADFGQITLNNAWSAAAFPGDVTVKSARTPVQVSTAHLTACIGCPAGGERRNVDGITHRSN